MAAVIGDPVRHSLSPVMHNAAFAALDLDWVYVALEVPAGGAATAVAGARALGLAGLSVTMPHKTEVASLVDRLSPTAETLGAVNTVVRQGEVLFGDNTDGAGFLDSLRLDEGFDPAGRRCVVIGAGGAARSVILALAGAGAAEVTVVNRSAAGAEAAATLAGRAGRVGAEEAVKDADLVVNATPVGMNNVVAISGQPAPSVPFPTDLLGAGQLVVDLVYAPPTTALMTAAQARGASAVGGLGMLLHQAAHAFRLWTAEEPPLEIMSAAAIRAVGHLIAPE